MKRSQPKQRKPASVRYISRTAEAKAKRADAALESLQRKSLADAVQRLQHENAVMSMMLSVIVRRLGPHMFTREEAATSQPEKLWIGRDGDVMRCWWGDESDAPKTPGELMQAAADGPPPA